MSPPIYYKFKNTNVFADVMVSALRMSSHTKGEIKILDKYLPKSLLLMSADDERGVVAASDSIKR